MSNNNVNTNSSNNKELSRETLIENLEENAKELLKNAGKVARGKYNFENFIKELRVLFKTFFNNLKLLYQDDNLNFDKLTPIINEITNTLSGKNSSFIKFFEKYFDFLNKIEIKHKDAETTIISIAKILNYDTDTFEKAQISNFQALKETGAQSLTTYKEREAKLQQQKEKITNINEKQTNNTLEITESDEYIKKIENLITAYCNKFITKNNENNNFFDDLKNNELKKEAFKHLITNVQDNPKIKLTKEQKKILKQIEEYCK